MTEGNGVVMRDVFADDRRRGRVLGTTSSSGAPRTGNDAARSIAIDHHALRIVSLTTAAWGRATLSYGPHALEEGFAFGALLLNGHNTSQHEVLGETFMTRMKRWLRGNEMQTWPAHVWSWARHGHRRWAIRRFRHWFAIDRATRKQQLRGLDENLSVGFIPQATSIDPTREGYSFVMHATGHENGELWASGAQGTRRILRGVQNVPLYLLIAVRGDSVMYLAASVDGVRGLPALPAVRPLAVVTRVPTSESAFCAIQQAVSGQIGWAIDTRVWETVAADVADWFAADGGPTIQASLVDLLPGAKQSWSAASPVGLVRVVGVTGTTFSIRWRSATEEEGWVLSIFGDRAELTGGRDSAADPERTTTITVEGSALDVQITDDGQVVGAYVNGQLLFDDWTSGGDGADNTGLVIELAEGRLESVEAFPRELCLPRQLLCAAPRLPGASRTWIHDAFAAPEGELHGRAAGDSGSVWRRMEGSGTFTVGGDGARVEATAAAPLLGRTSYMLPWNGDSPVELEIDVVPPGGGQGEGERGRAGVVFWQDDGNSISISTWLDDHYAGSSVSSFFRLGGFEDLYDAVWTNVGRRISWGHPYRLRVAFDGMIYAAYVNDELVLYRSLVDVYPDQQALRINKVGIVANWEWGTDTGSVFRSFTARGPESLIDLENAGNSDDQRWK